MNKVILIGRLTRDPDVRYSQGEDPQCHARYTLAVDRGGKQTEGQQSADFIVCNAWGKNGEFAEKYLLKGIKICVEGSIRTGSYTNREGQKVYTTEIAVSHQEFCEKKGDEVQRTQVYDAPGAKPTPAAGPARDDGFINIPDGVEDDGLPFN